MNLYNITFSPTGGTQKVSDLIMSEFMGKKSEISLLPAKTDYSEYSFENTDLCVIAVPSFGGRVPRVVIPRLLKMQGNSAKAVLACVYGNRAYEDTLLELKNTVKKAGFIPIAAITAIAEHSIMHQFAAGRPDEQDQIEIKKFAKQIAGEMENGKKMPEVSVPGNENYREFGGSSFLPHTDSSCTKCGICAKECPVAAIDETNPQKTDKDRCISCMRCISVCPQGARGLNNLLLEAASKQKAKAFAIKRSNELFIG